MERINHNIDAGQEKAKKLFEDTESKADDQSCQKIFVEKVDHFQNFVAGLSMGPKAKRMLYEDLDQFFSERIEPLMTAAKKEGSKKEAASLFEALTRPEEMMEVINPLETEIEEAVSQELIQAAEDLDLLLDQSTTDAEVMAAEERARINDLQNTNSVVNAELKMVNDKREIAAELFRSAETAKQEDRAAFIQQGNEVLAEAGATMDKAIGILEEQIKAYDLPDLDVSSEFTTRLDEMKALLVKIYIHHSDYKMQVEEMQEYDKKTKEIDLKRAKLMSEVMRNEVYRSVLQGIAQIAQVNPEAFQDMPEIKEWVEIVDGEFTFTKRFFEAAPGIRKGALLRMQSKLDYEANEIMREKESGSKKLYYHGKILLADGKIHEANIVFKNYYPLLLRDDSIPPEQKERMVGEVKFFLKRIATLKCGMVASDLNQWISQRSERTFANFDAQTNIIEGAKTIIRKVSALIDSGEALTFEEAVKKAGLDKEQIWVQAGERMTLAEVMDVMGVIFYASTIDDPNERARMVMASQKKFDDYCGSTKVARRVVDDHLKEDLNGVQIDKKTLMALRVKAGQDAEENVEKTRGQLQAELKSMVKQLKFVQDKLVTTKKYLQEYRDLEAERDQLISQLKERTEIQWKKKNGVDHLERDFEFDDYVKPEYLEKRTREIVEEHYQRLVRKEKYLKLAETFKGVDSEKARMVERAIEMDDLRDEYGNFARDSINEGIDATAQAAFDIGTMVVGMGVGAGARLAATKFLAKYVARGGLRKAAANVALFTIEKAGEGAGMTAAGTGIQTMNYLLKGEDPTQAYDGLLGAWGKSTLMFAGIGIGSKLVAGTVGRAGVKVAGSEAAVVGVETSTVQTVRLSAAKFGELSASGKAAWAAYQGTQIVSETLMMSSGDKIVDIADLYFNDSPISTRLNLDTLAHNFYNVIKFRIGAKLWKATTLGKELYAREQAAFDKAHQITGRADAIGQAERARMADAPKMPKKSRMERVLEFFGRRPAETAREEVKFNERELAVLERARELEAQVKEWVEGAKEWNGLSKERTAELEGQLKEWAKEAEAMDGHAKEMHLLKKAILQIVRLGSQFADVSISAAKIVEGSKDGTPFYLEIRLSNDETRRFNPLELQSNFLLGDRYKTSSTETAAMRNILIKYLKQNNLLLETSLKEGSSSDFVSTKKAEEHAVREAILDIVRPGTECPGGGKIVEAKIVDGGRGLAPFLLELRLDTGEIQNWNPSEIKSYLLNRGAYKTKDAQAEAVRQNLIGFINRSRLQGDPNALLLQRGLAENDIAKMVQHVRRIDPRTGEPYPLGISKVEKRALIREGIEYLRKTVKTQERFKEQILIVAERAKRIQELIQKKPDASEIELRLLALDAEALNKLSSDQIAKIEKAISKIMERRRLIEKYQGDISKNPKAFVEKVFGLKAGSLKGPVTVITEGGVIQIVAENRTDYDLMYGKSNDSDGFAPREVKGIPELAHLITVSRTDSRVVFDHERQHQYNLLLFGEHLSSLGGVNTKPIVYAKDEIIAYLRDGAQTPEQIVATLCEDNGLYDYYTAGIKQKLAQIENAAEALFKVDEAERKQIEAEVIPKAKRELNDLRRQWEQHKRRVAKAMEHAINVRDADGKIDLNLLAVTPIDQWGLLAKGNKKLGEVPRIHETEAVEGPIRHAARESVRFLAAGALHRQKILPDARSVEAAEGQRITEAVKKDALKPLIDEATQFVRDNPEARTEDVLNHLATIVGIKEGEMPVLEAAIQRTREGIKRADSLEKGLGGRFKFRLMLTKLKSSDPRIHENLKNLRYGDVKSVKREHPDLLVVTMDSDAYYKQGFDKLDTGLTPNVIFVPDGSPRSIVDSAAHKKIQYAIREFARKMDGSKEVAADYGQAKGPGRLQRKALASISTMLRNQAKHQDLTSMKASDLLGGENGPGRMNTEVRDLAAELTRLQADGIKMESLISVAETSRSVAELLWNVKSIRTPDQLEGTLILASDKVKAGLKEVLESGYDSQGRIVSDLEKMQMIEGLEKALKSADKLIAEGLRLEIPEVFNTREELDVFKAHVLLLSNRRRAERVEIEQNFDANFREGQEVVLNGSKYHIMNIDADGNVLLGREISNHGNLQGKVLKSSKAEILRQNPPESIVKKYMSRPQPEQTKKLIEQGFKLQQIIEIDGIKFHVGEVQRFVDSLGETSRYFAIILVDKGDGVLLPRLTYMSTSGGRWKAVPSYESASNRYVKGRVMLDQQNRAVEEGYAHEANLDVRLADHLNSQLKSRKIAHRADQPVLNLFGIDFVVNKDIATYDSEVRSFDDGGALKAFKANGIRPGRVNVSELEGFVANADAKFPPGFLPDFSAKPLKTGEGHSTEMGNYKYEIHQGILNGKKVNWKMAHNEEGAIWIESIVPADAKVTTFGNANTVIDIGVLGLKPLEYAGQVRNDLNKPLMRKEGNIDLTPILDSFLPIRKFREARHIRRRGESGRHALEYNREPRIDRALDQSRDRLKEINKKIADIDAKLTRIVAAIKHLIPEAEMGLKDSEAELNRLHDRAKELRAESRALYDQQKGLHAAEKVRARYVEGDLVNLNVDLPVREGWEIVEIRDSADVVLKHPKHEGLILVKPQQLLGRTPDLGDTIAVANPG